MPSKIADRAASEAMYSVDNLPESDGKPMGETTRHVLLIVETLDALRAHFRDDSQMFIIGNVFVYYLNEIGVLARLAPDIFAVRGVGNEERRVYSVEREGKAPEFVIEFTSKKTKKSDLIHKKKTYAWLGVKEYFMFDPYGEHLKPQLVGFRLRNDEYIAISPQGKKLELRSDYLDLDLVPDRGRLRFGNPRTGELLRTHEEAEREREAEAAARRTAEAEAARLRAELAKLRQERQ